MRSSSTRTHQCYAYRCVRMVPSHLLMCPEHWAYVPKAIQAVVYETYRNGNTKLYHETIREARNAVAVALLPFGVESRVVSTHPAFYPGRVGVVKGIRAGANREEFPCGFDVTVELLDVSGLCAFDAADLKLAPVESEVPHA